jgi:phosphoribosylformylglycinamidine cyclo-ligase
MAAVLDRSSWTPPAIFQLVQQVGGVSQADIDATLNMGVGMVAILPQDQVPAALAALQARGVWSWPLGEIVASEGPGAARLV